MVKEFHALSLLGSYYCWFSWVCNLTLFLQDQQTLQLQKSSRQAEKIPQKRGYKHYFVLLSSLASAAFGALDIYQQSSEPLTCMQIILELSKSNEKLEVILLALVSYCDQKVIAVGLFCCSKLKLSDLWWLQTELQQLQQHLLLLKHAAHQHGIEHSSRLGTMLYDDGFLLPGNGNKTVVNTDSSPHETAGIGTVEESHNPRPAALPSDTFSETSMTHDVPQHSHRTHHQAQQAVSSP